jgi:hypothetical protein
LSGKLALRRSVSADAIVAGSKNRALRQVSRLAGNVATKSGIFQKCGKMDHGRLVGFFVKEVL